MAPDSELALDASCTGALYPGCSAYTLYSVFGRNIGRILCFRNAHGALQVWRQVETFLTFLLNFKAVCKM